MSLDKLSVEFFGPQSAGTKVLESVSLSIHAGEFVAIVGPSGCGKTTLLRAMGGLLGSSSRGPGIAQVTGSVLIDGFPSAEARKKGVIGFAFQNPVMLPWRTVAMNVGLPLELRGLERQPERVHEALEKLGLGGCGDLLPSQLSGGMKQRANIARALISNPRLLLLDEPFGSLDEITRERLNMELLALHRLTAPTVVLVTHSLREACFLADRVIILSSRPSRILSDIPSLLTRDRCSPFEGNSGFLEMLELVRSAFSRT